MSSSLSLLDRLRARLVLRQSSYFDLLRQMVEINSFTGNPEGIEALSRLTAAAFESLGFSAESVPARDRRHGNHLLMTRGADASAPQIALISHLDTVFPPEEEEEHDFRWREAGDRLYGPGTVDIKGGTTLIYMMLDALRATVPELFSSVSWAVFLNAAEERGATDFGEICLDRLDSARTLACLVFEGGRMKGEVASAVVARKGMAVFDVEVEGRSAHAGTGHRRGASALLQLADVIRQIESWTDYEQALTFNVGTAHGGSVVNRVPHRAHASVEMRAFRPEVFEFGLERMRSLAGVSTVKSAYDDYRCKVKVETAVRQAPWPRNPGSERLLGAWQEAGELLALRVEAEERGGLSDGNQLWHRVPVLDGLGPAGGNAHCSERSADGSKDQEFAVKSSFAPKALLNIVAVLALLRQES